MKQLLTVVLALFCLAATAQNPNVVKGDKLYTAKLYDKAIAAYQKALEAGPNFECSYKIGDCFVGKQDYVNAEKWYAQSVKFNNASADAFLKYANTLMANGKYEDAKTWYQKYGATGGNMETGKKYAEMCDYAIMLKSAGEGYKVKPYSVNTQYGEMLSLVTKDNIVYFSSNRKSGKKNPFSFLFYNVYMVNVQQNMKNFLGYPMKGKMQSKYYDAPGAFSADGSKFFITRTNLKDGKPSLDKNGRERKMIVEVSGKKWTVTAPVSFNSPDYSCEHPCLSADGKTMYFASDMPGGQGGLDIWMSTWAGDKWTKPENLGSKINTSGDENYPYIHKDGVLFFSSKGHKGLGGYDIFYSKMENPSWSAPLNAGFPLNSSMDDFGAVFNTDKPTGFVTSNRSGGKGSYDIYTFERRTPVRGIVVDKFTGEKLADVSLTITDFNNQKTTVKTNASGEFLYFGDMNRDFMLEGSRKEYKSIKTKFNTNGISNVGDLNLKVEMERDLAVMGIVMDDASGQPLSGVRVKVRANGKEEIVTTGADGKYMKPLMPNTEYSLLITKPGYKPEVIELSNAELTSGKPIEKQTRLKAGSYVMIEGFTINKTTKEKLPNTNIRLVLDTARTAASIIQSDENGKFVAYVPLNGNFSLFGTKVGYFTGRVDVSDFNAKYDTTVVSDIELMPFSENCIVRTIYFDYKKSDLNPISMKEMQGICFFMQENPNVQLEIGAHTDSRGGDAYNNGLSKKRAESAVKQLLKMGCDKKNLTSKGYGERKLVNNCKDNVKCTEEQHSENRRCEIKICKISTVTDKPSVDPVIIKKPVEKPIGPPVKNK